jgi:hypothetical protein
MRTILSPGPHPAVGGKHALAASVMSAPIIAKSPESSSRMSGQLLAAPQRFAPVPGSGPSLRKIFIIFDLIRQHLSLPVRIVAKKR